MATLKEEKYTEFLKQLQLKATPRRIAVLDILAAEHAYSGPEEIWKKMKRHFCRIGLPTVYRILEELSEKGVISKIIHPSRQLYYYYCSNAQHHHHFICVSCRKVEDLNFCATRDIEKEVARNLKGKVLSHILQVNGLCGSCSKKRLMNED
jgi:Fur family transcriptional regulator, ferric uptake regulator